VLAALVLAGACGVRDTPPRETVADGPRPNVVVVVIDDLRWDEFGAAGHPFVKTPNIDRLAAEGVWFTNAFHAVPLCSPNRASLLTGQFPSRHGIIDNVARDFASHRLETFPKTLRAQGYETGFVGKWHMGNDPTPRPGFDYWVSFPGQGRTMDPELYEDGRLQVVPGYVTDLLTDRAVEFINRERDRPFALYLAHKAVHPDARQKDDGSIDMDHPSAYIPAPRHRGVYDGAVFARRPNVVASPDQLGDKPALRRALAYRASDDITRMFGGILDPGTSDETIRRRAEMLLSVDEGLGRIFAALEARGVLDQTLIVLTSDNGFFFGEHGLSLERRLPYEESIRNPLLIRYPPLAAAGARISPLVLSVDLAPTVLDVARAPVGDHIQGRSLVPLLRGESRGWRDALLVEFYTYENPMPWLVDMDYRAVRTERHKYVHWMQHPDLDELYDLAADPYEMRNLVHDPAAARIRGDLRARLGVLVLEAMGLGEPHQIAR
jgi:N-acetylglucosamine-6-sulfatase